MTVFALYGSNFTLCGEHRIQLVTYRHLVSRWRHSIPHTHLEHPCWLGTLSFHLQLILSTVCKQCSHGLLLSLAWRPSKRSLYRTRTPRHHEHNLRVLWRTRIGPMAHNSIRRYNFLSQMDGLILTGHGDCVGMLITLGACTQRSTKLSAAIALEFWSVKPAGELSGRAQRQLI
jgi:hypothetical protein